MPSQVDSLPDDITFSGGTPVDSAPSDISLDPGKPKKQSLIDKAYEAGKSLAEKIAPNAAATVASTLGIGPAFALLKDNPQINDVATSLKQGVEQMPGTATGLLDVAPALVFGERPYSDIANWVGKKTGFQPEKLAADAQKNFSPEHAASQQEIDAKWKDPNAGVTDIAGAYLKNPMYSLDQVANSAPSMAAGGVLSRGMMVAGLERAAGEKAAAIAGGAGEGAIQAGQQMQQYQGTDHRKNAIAALGSGTIDALIAGGAGRIANKLGLETAETAIAKGGHNLESALPAWKRIGGGVLSEGALQEVPQSGQEQAWQNYADNAPLGEGVARQAVEGGIAGGVMGAGANIHGEAHAQPDGAADTQPTDLAAEINQNIPAPATHVDSLPSDVTTATEPAPVPVKAPMPATTTAAVGRLGQISGEESAINARLDNMTPEYGYGPEYNDQRTQLHDQLSSLAVERNDIAKVHPVAIDQADKAARLADLNNSFNGTNPQPLTIDEIKERRALLADPAITTPAVAPAAMATGEQDGATGQQDAGLAGNSSEAAGNQPAGSVANEVAPGSGGPVLSGDNTAASTAMPVAGPVATGSGAQDGAVAPTETPTAPDTNALQNRSRDRIASVAQMNSIAAHPDYLRLGPSRAPESGAPMVFSNDDAAHIPDDQLGKQDVAVLSDGRRIPFRYAVVDANAVQPSNFSDGRANPEYASTAPGVIKSLNNGRAAGLRTAFDKGTAAPYVDAMANDATAHGISADVIQRMQRPMLVRVYSHADNAKDIGAKSQGSTLGLSATEQAHADAKLMTSNVLALHTGGDLLSAANRDFVRAFMGKAGDLSSMLDADGNVSQDGRRRIEAGLMAAAYGDSGIVSELFESADTDIKSIGDALREAAGRWASMRDMAKSEAIDPQVDTTGNLMEAVQLIRKARAEGKAISDLAGQGDLMSGTYIDPLTEGWLRIFYRGQDYARANSKDRVISGMMMYIDGANATRADAGLFGEDSRVTPGDMLKSTQERLNEQFNPQTTQGGLFSGGGKPDVQSAGRNEPQDGGRVSPPGGQEAGSKARQESQSKTGQGVQEGRQSHENPALAGKVSEPSEVIGSIGKAPNSAAPITVVDGVVQIDGYPAQNFDTGEDITVPAGADFATVKKALIDGGAVASSQKVFAAHAEKAAPAKESNPVGNEPILTAGGKPFGTKGTAEFGLKARKLGDTHHVVPVDGGFAIVPKSNEAQKPAETANASTGVAPVSLPETAAVSPEYDKAKSDLTDALGDLGDIFGKNVKMNITPEQERKLLPVLTRLFDAAFRMGYHKFKEASRFVLDTIRAKMGNEVADHISLDHLQGSYIGMSGRYREQGADTKKDVVAVEHLDELNQPESENVTDQHSGANLERNSQNANPENGMGAQGVSDGRGADGGTGEPGIRGTSTAGSEPASSFGPAGREAAAAGERGDFAPSAETPGTETSAAGDLFGERSRDAGIEGAPVEPPAAAAIKQTAVGPVQIIDQRAAQFRAQAIPVFPGVKANIDATLPFLHEGQRADVHFAETRFAKPDGHGVMFTNGTGTGKTASGLGIVKRLERMGKTNTLIVVPSDKIAADWIDFGKNLKLDINPLLDTKSNGRGITITSYANFGQNQTLADRSWDAVVTDEAHYLMQAKDGGKTNALNALRAITLHPDGAYDRHRMIERKDYAEQDRIHTLLKDNIERVKSSSTPANEIPALEIENDRLSQAAEDIDKKLRDSMTKMREDVKAAENGGRSKVVFLSATPFAYEKAVHYAEGYLFTYPGKDNTGQRYNSGSPADRFMMQHFGYRMRTNKLTEPGPEVDRGLMQRQFNSWLKKEGALSGRMLDVAHDYDRRFVLADSEIGSKIDDGLSWLWENKRMYPVWGAVHKKFDHLSRRYLLEAIKAQAVIPMVKAQLAAGRKVVVFHDFKKGGAFNPFDLSMLRNSDEEVQTEGPDGKPISVTMGSLVQEFEAARPDLQELPLAGLRSPIEAFTRAFPDLMLFNGDIPPKARRSAVEQFQNDNSGKNLILVQSAAGKEGISLHDTTGKHQRVLYNLGLPTQPTTAIQQEGRIYRTGQASNAMFRYLNTGTNWERFAFADTIARRSSTAENLALGEQARALMDGFIEAYEESDHYPVGHEGEGTGGKERDAAANNALSEWDRAMTMYFAQQKKTSRTKAQEGTDYFATPEPLGLKMVEWADIHPGDSVLEPSAGHGAIARWFPELNARTVVEQSPELASRIKMVTDAKLLQERFEDFNTINKFDAVVMNPPFGTAGRTAVDHIAKAAQHLRNGGRIVALLPSGPAADAKFDKWFHEEQSKPAKPLGSITIDGKEVPIYKGDTVESRASWAPASVVTGWRDGGPIVKAIAPEFGGAVTTISGESIKSVQPTGSRTETFNPTADLHLVANILLPRVTFERAGTDVPVRIVVIEKQTDKELAAKIQQRDRDYTNADSIKEFFDRIKESELPARQNTTPEDVQAATDRAHETGLPAPSAYTGELVEHVTGKGKTLKGAIRGDLSKEEAQAIDPYTFKKNGGWFIREKHLGGGNAVNSPNAPYIAEPGKPGYDDPYEHIETRDGTKPAQLAAGRAALAAVETRILGANHSGRHGATLLASGISADFRASGGTSLVGQEAKTPEQLATVAQVLRDPRFETFRAVFTNSAGSIIGERAYSSRLPAAVYMPENLSLQIAKDSARLGASGYWMLHNHPSGAAMPSKNDRELTQRTAAKVHGFLGHVIIDHNEYGHITIDKAGEAIADVIKAPQLAGMDMSANPEVSHPILGEKIQTPEALALLSKRLQIKDGYVTIIGTDAQGRVALAVEVPAASLRKIKNNAYGKLQAAAILKRATRETGSMNLFAVVPGHPLDYPALLDSGVLLDVMDADGYSAGNNGIMRTGQLPVTSAERRGGKNSVTEPGASYSRAPDTGNTIHLDDLNAVTQRFRTAFPGLPVHILEDESFAPKSLRDDIASEGADGSVAGAYHNGEVYLFQSGIHDIEHAEQTVLHEAAHAGLQKMFGDGINMAMLNIHSANQSVKAEANQLREKYGYSAVTATQEVLADMGLSATHLKGWDKLVAWARAKLRKFGVVKSWTDNDVAALVLSALKAAKSGPTAPISNTLFSRKDQQRSAYGETTPEQAKAITNVVGKPKTMGQRMREFKQHWQKNLVQGIVDQYAPIRDYSMDGYIQARMTKASDSTLEAVFMYGKPVLDENGDTKIEFNKANGAMNGFASVMAKLDGEHDRFLLWVAAQRAERLADVGLENLFTPEDIKALKTLNQGNLQNGQPRLAAYATALKGLNDYNDAVLTIAAERGLINDATRKMYKDMPYVPFYRLREDDSVQGFAAQAGLVNKSAWKKLKGGTAQLNEDLLANTLQNWSHLITASAQNRAAKSTLLAAAKQGAATEVPASYPGKGTVKFKDNVVRTIPAGKTYIENGEEKLSHGNAQIEINVERKFVVEDAHLMDAIASLGQTVKVPLVMRKFKHYLTIGVTINPAFKLRNLMRDTIQSMALADLSLNPLKNIHEGIKATGMHSEVRAQMLAGGGIIRFGSMLDGNSADLARELITNGVDKNHILDDTNKVEGLWKHWIKPAFDAYQEFGDRGEQVNRAALYQRLLDKGMSHGEASYWARDLMDFSMSGKWAAVRYLTQTVPFMNARLQGLYKLGKSGVADKKRFGYVVGGVVMASLMLLGAYHDDEDWKKREDWDRDNYWWFKVGGTAFRIPKPFELGAIGTLAERGVELMTDDEMTGARFRGELGNIISNQLSMNPTPQLVKPLIDLWANRDSFSGRPIETMGMDNLKPEDRYSTYTTGTAKLLGELGLPNPAQLVMGNYDALSPVQIDFMVRSYFGWLGTATTTALDWGIFKPLSDSGADPSMKLKDAFFAGNFVESLPSNSSRYVTQMYNQSKEIEQAYGSYRAAIKSGDTAHAASIMSEDGDKLRKYRQVEAMKRIEGKISMQIRIVTANKTMSAEDKRAKIDELNQKKDEIAQRFSMPN